MFEASVYSARRAALAQELERRGARSGIALFPGNDESPNRYPADCHAFRQDSSWLYFFGIPAPGLRAILDLDTDRATLYCDDPSMDDLIWTGPRPDSAEFAEAAAFSDRKPSSAFDRDAGAARASGRRVRYLPPCRGETKIALGRALGVDTGALAAGADPDLVDSVIALREIKEDRELAELDSATSLTAAMHRALLERAKPGWTEAQAAALVQNVAAEAGASLSFTTIATIHGETLHAMGRSGRMERGGLFLLDAGAESAEGYAGDLTTTFPVGPVFSPRQADLYRLVLGMGAAVTARLGPGVRFVDLHRTAALELARGLKDLGIMGGDPSEAAAEGACALFFPHGLGHMIGLDVHDMEGLGEDRVGYGDGLERSAQFGLRSLRLAKTLRPGMVHSVEPGIYFIPGLIAGWRAERRHAAFIDYRALEEWEDLGGVRNEEDWTVTETGARRLGPEFDKSLAAIEAARRNA